MIESGNFLCALGAWSFLAAAGTGTTFHCDPARGAPDNPGSAAEPWRSIEEVIDRGLVECRDSAGKTARPGAIVRGGDTILLHTGYHGRIRLRAGYNEDFITIAAAPGATADVCQVIVDGGRRWRIKGLRVSPALAPEPPRDKIRHLVQLGEHGAEDSSELVVEDCFVFSAADSSRWSAQEWVERPAGGIWLGRHGRGHVARNNHLLNTRMGIDLCAPECLCEGNVVENFSGDGIRVTRDSIIVRHNVIKNNFVGAADGDDNHDDGIQCFLFNQGRGLVRDVTVEGNIILQRERPGLPLPNPLQGIGFFDGPLVGFTVKDNIVRVDQWHGVALYDAQGCRITGNVCWNPDASSPRQPWVMLGQKRGLAKGNLVEGNLARSFPLKADPEVTARDNREVTARSFGERARRSLAAIVARFGERHPVSREKRLAEPF